MKFFENSILLSRAETLNHPDCIPLARGVYAWFFSSIPPLVPVSDCYVRNDLTLLYVGISPKNAVSRQNLRKRVKYHYCGNAEGSTLRLTLGVLLTELSDFPLRRVGKGKRMTFTHLGEQWLDNWMADHAHVCWVQHDEPWILENELLKTYSLPLNIQDNRHHPFSVTLCDMRRAAKAKAREMPIANEHNQRRT